MDKHLIILGTRGIPAQYGGFETFAEELAKYLVQQGWKVTVYCQNEIANYSTQWNGINLVYTVPNVFKYLVKGALGTVLFDLYAICHALRHHRKALWMTLGYNTAFLNILPWLFRCKQIIHMDGIEWRRGKWNGIIKSILFINYFIAGLVADKLIADHTEIKKILEKTFPAKKIKTIAYGSHEILSANINLPPFKDYVLVLARFVPENNIHLIVQAWSSKQRNRKLVIVGNNNNPYGNAIKNMASDDIIFTGAIYDKETVQALRFHAQIYIHGHSVGGTNPSLIEALGAGNPVIAHDNVFNRGVLGKAGLYFSDPLSLEKLFDQLCADQLPLNAMKQQSRELHQKSYQWKEILSDYEALLNTLFTR